jgi:hypothetical protein
MPPSPPLTPFSFRRFVRAHERQHPRGKLPSAPASRPQASRGHAASSSNARHFGSQQCPQRSSCLFDVRGINGPEIVGCDPRLNADPEEITRFFISHLKKPSASGLLYVMFLAPTRMHAGIKVSIQGTHQKREHYTTRDQNGTAHVAQ